MCANEIAVVAGIEKQQRQAADVAIHPFQREAALERLTIAWSRFSLDTVAPVGSGDHDVPRPTVVGRRERNLGLKPERSMHPGPETTDQGNVGGITKRLAGGECSNGELQSHDGQEG